MRVTAWKLGREARVVGTALVEAPRAGRGGADGGRVRGYIFCARTAAT